MIASEIMRPTFWLAAVQIMGINILLSGDNAVVIALACRALPPKERFWGMVLGAGVAAILLILFTGIVATLLKLPYLKLAGGIALFWVAIGLVAPQPHDAEDTPEAVEDLWRAVRVVVVANIVMSLDNVIAVAAAAKGDYLLLGLGLAISIPIVIAGSALVPGPSRAFSVGRMGRRGVAGVDRGRSVSQRSHHCPVPGQAIWNGYRAQLVAVRQCASHRRVHLHDVDGHVRYGLVLDGTQWSPRVGF